jgi:hypothetical protein
LILTLVVGRALAMVDMVDTARIHIPIGVSRIVGFG